jgi:hypothetical protein
VTFYFEQFLVHYVISFFYVMYYILSSNAEFPEDLDVEAVLAAPEESMSKTTLEQCAQRFWLMPVANLQGILPGVLEMWDVGYSKEIPSNVEMPMFDPEDMKWMDRYLAYAEEVVKAYSELVSTATYVTVPACAIAWL